MKHTISNTRWLANPNQGHRHFLRNFLDLIRYQSEDSYAHSTVTPIYLPQPNHVDYRT